MWIVHVDMHAQSKNEGLRMRSSHQGMRRRRKYVPSSLSDIVEEEEEEVEEEEEEEEPSHSKPTRAARFHPFPGSPPPSRRSPGRGATRGEMRAPRDASSRDDQGSAGLLDRDEMLDRQTGINPALRRTRRTRRLARMDDGSRSSGQLMDGEQELVRGATLLV